PPMDTTGANSITDYSTRYKDSADPYGYICLYGLNPAREMLRRDTSSSTPRNVTKEEYLSIMTEIIFGQKTILTAEGGDYLKDW
ncbi:MAG: hypothetical protein FWH38_04565, partial [Treponema sp.]|nr:hypothetical protein [Treponema sp.]